MMNKIKRYFVIGLILLNLLVLLGQVWPDGAPPFANTINIIFLSITLIYFVLSVLKKPA